MQQPSRSFWSGMRVCVTGGTGFLGWQIVQKLAGLNARVRVFGLPPRSEELAAKLRGHDVAHGDIRDVAAVRAAVKGCALVLHAAGPVATWGPVLRDMHDIHCRGTRNVLACLPVGARMVHTSSIVTVGASSDQTSLNEDSTFNLRHIKMDYVHAKKASEEIVLASHQEAVIVNPSHLIGPEDYESSHLGQMCLRTWRGHARYRLPGGLNVIDVRDAAHGHLLAAEHGKPGRRYILAGENWTLSALGRLMAETGGMSSWWWPRLPLWLVAGASRLSVARAWLLNKRPNPAPQLVRIMGYHWFYDAARARNELGFLPRSTRESLSDAFAWYMQQGMLPKYEQAAQAA
jgi:dihydroflavonol-4-reductase